MLQRLVVTGYRSIRNLVLELGGTDVLVGPNGCGKSNLYRAVRLLAFAAEGRLARALADEGGLPSVLSATEAPKPCTTVELGCRIDDWEYELAIALTPAGNTTAFAFDPCVQTERLTLRAAKPIVFLERTGVRTMVRNADGRRVDYPHDLHRGETALGQLHDPAQFPELSALRAQILGWRFYHQFRTDEDSPLRRPQVGAFTPILAHDGRDLAAALQTIREQSPGPCGEQQLDTWLRRAFPDAALSIVVDGPVFGVELDLPRMNRPLRAAELSDGTLRFLCLLAALLSPRPPRLLVLNEPEASLHANVLPALAELVVEAGKHSQIVMTTHSTELGAAIAAATGRPATELVMVEGETRIAGRGRYE